MTKGAMLAVVLVTSVAHAGPQDEARTLFDLGQKEMDAKQVDAACNSFERSLELDPQIGTRLNLADCRERQGRLVEAYQLFAESVAEAARTKKEGREKFAHERAAALAARLVKVTLKVAAPDLTGLSITLGDHTLARADWTAPSFAMPGAINVLATAPGHLPFRTTANGIAGKELAIEVPALGVVAAPPADKPAPSPEKPADKPAPPPVTSVAAEPAPETPAPSHGSRVPLIVGGVGAGLVVTSFGLGLHAKSRYDTAYNNKSASGVKSAQSEADVGTGFAIAGGVAIGIGIVLYLRERNDNHPTVAPVVGDHTVGLSLVGPL